MTFPLAHSRWVVKFAIAWLMILVWSNSAFATVELQPNTVLAGSVSDVTFRVANDRADAFTKNVKIVFPASPRFKSVDAIAPSGWSSSVDAMTGTVSSITFDSGAISHLETADFILTMTVPTDGERVVFLVLQQYSDGQVVRWSVDPQKSPGDARPAPVLGIEGGITPSTEPPTTTSTTLTPSDEQVGLYSPGRLLVGLGLAVLVTVFMRTRRIQRKQRLKNEAEGPERLHKP